MIRDYSLLDSDTLSEFETALRNVYSALNLARIYDKDVKCDDFFNEISSLYKSVLDYQVLRYKNLSENVNTK